MSLGVSFIDPRQLGAVEDQLGRSILPSVEWRTGQSGAPLDSLVHHRIGPVDSPVHDLLPNLAYPIVAPRDQLAHLKLSGAHRTVRCAQPTVGATMCRTKIARPTVGDGDCWLTGQSGEPPDSLMNFSRTPLILFPRAASLPRMTHRTVRCTTGQSGEL
jgi:hypothetical protein